MVFYASLHRIKLDRGLPPSGLLQRQVHIPGDLQVHVGWCQALGSMEAFPSCCLWLGHASCLPVLCVTRHSCRSMGVGSSSLNLTLREPGMRSSFFLFFFFMGTNGEAALLLACLTNWAFLSPPELNVPHAKETIANTSGNSRCTPGVCGRSLTFTGF